MKHDGLLLGLEFVEVVSGQVDAAAAELGHRDLERHPRAQARVEEQQAQGLADEDLAGPLALGSGSELEQVLQLVLVVASDVLLFFSSSPLFASSASASMVLATLHML